MTCFFLYRSVQFHTQRTHTLFAGCQRLYAESLSTYVRQFLNRMDKADVDYIKGLAPAIAIEQ